MGFCVHYKAFSPQSRFYKRLQQEKAMFILMMCSFARNFQVIAEEEDTEQTLEWLMEKFPDVFSSEAKTKRLIDDFQIEVDTASIRSAYVEKTTHIFEKRLTQELTKRQSKDTAWIRAILYGECDFDPHSLYGTASSPSLVIIPMVQKAASILSEVDICSLFRVEENFEEKLQKSAAKDAEKIMDISLAIRQVLLKGELPRKELRAKMTERVTTTQEEHYAEGFCRWRKFYLEAAEAQEIVLIGRS